MIGVQSNCTKIGFYWKWTTRKLAFYLALTNFIMLGIRINWKLVSVSRYLQLNLETLSKSCNETMKITHPHHFQKLDIENRVIWLEIRTKILLGGANLSQGQGGFNSISRLSHGHRHYLLINVLSDNERSKVECFTDILKPILVYKS